MTTQRCGFTVVELMVGLVVAGTVLTLAGRVFAEAAVGAHRIVDSRRSFDSIAVGRRWLSGAFRSLQVGRDRDDSFGGGADQIEFTARLQQPSGWFAAERLRIARRGSALIAVTSADTIPLFKGVRQFEAHYLLRGGERSEWLRGWYSPSTAPVAIRLVIGWHSGAADTLLLVVGGRG